MPATILVVDDDHMWSIDRLVGRSPALIEVREAIQRIARGPASPVLFLGEIGTGRSLAARIVHHLSDRSTGPFASRPSAVTRSAPLESCHGGTWFLSGLHQSGTELQQTLRQFLAEQAVTPVDGTAPIADVRIMASSDARLEDAVEAGTFARELYERLSATTVHLPPLRARTSDVEPLVRHYIDIFNRDLGTQVEGLTPEALDALEAYSWPGNVRELRTVVERAMLVADSGMLQSAQFALDGVARREGSEMDLPPSGVNLERLERDLVVQALQRTGGNQTRAATLLGLNRDQVRYRIEKFGLSRD